MKRVFLVLISATLLSSLFATPGNAANAADWKPGYIIDDAVFNNKNAMDVTSIQNFLNAKVPTCDNWGTKPFAGTTRRAYAESRGEVFPLKCLKEYYENPTTKQNNLEGRPIPAGGLSAAQIISAAAQGYNINPQVLLILLQKEQGLVTDDWARFYQYRSATGFGCPDTNLCDSQYYGFYNQVNAAARQFRIYANNPNSFNHRAGQANNIRLSPIISCGTMSVFIQNQATASLYNYTPYTSNQAAINNLYGTGDDCSSYGNRNFWRYFVDWFGSPYTNYSWQTISQDAYFDATKTQQIDLGKLGPGQRYYLTLRVRNTGNVTWNNSGSNPVNLGTFSPQDRASPFCDASWIGGAPGCNRVTTMRESQVKPGQDASFEFYVTTPETPGSYNEIYAPVSEGAAWMNSSTVSFPMIVHQAFYSGAVTGQFAYSNNTKQQNTDIRHLVPGQRYYMGVTVKNTGNVVWRNNGTNPMSLGTIGTRDRMSPFCDNGTWQGCNRAAVLREHQVLPGQTGSFEYWITAPQFGAYTETYAPVVEGKTWMDDLPITFSKKVEPYTFALNGVRAYTDSSKQKTININNLDPGQRYFVSVEVSNTGWAAWQKLGSNPITLGTALPKDHNSAICDGTWINCKRAAQLHEYTVNSGQNGSFEFWITAPETPGSYTESFTPVVEGINWMGSNTIDLGIKVNQPRYTWDIMGQFAYTNSAKTAAANLASLQPGQRYYLTMLVKNTGNTTWKKTGTTPMSIGTASPRDRASAFCDSGTWLGCNRPNTIHEYAVAPGQIGSFEFWITAPSVGTYNEIFAPIIEGVTWLDSHTASFPMTVKN
ncbi:MAG TPA: hypothetical protein VJM32_05265 [Candidatus Saccharimonadales bacterium]|nr:hypothetical protein [Candidatus Saccharimonadales bacterium]